MYIHGVVNGVDIHPGKGYPHDVTRCAVEGHLPSMDPLHQFIQVFLQSDTDLLGVDLSVNNGKSKCRLQRDQQRMRSHPLMLTKSRNSKGPKTDP